MVGQGPLSCWDLDLQRVLSWMIQNNPTETVFAVSCWWLGGVDLNNTSHDRPYRAGNDQVPCLIRTSGSTAIFPCLVVCSMNTCRSRLATVWALLAGTIRLS